MGTGTYASPINATLPPQSSLPISQLNDSCEYKSLNPSLLVSSPPDQCNARNPRVIQQYFVDTPGCACQACPSGFTSLGGPLQNAVCFPTTIVQSFNLVLVARVPPERRLSEADGIHDRIRSLQMGANTSFAEVVFNALTQVMEDEPNKLVGALGPIGPIEPDGYVVHVGSLADGSSAFSADFKFNGSSLALDALLKAVNSVDLEDADACAAYVELSGWDFCAAFANVSDLSDFKQLDAYEVGRRPLQFIPLLISGCLTFISRIFSGLGKFADQTNKVKKRPDSRYEGKWVHVSSHLNFFVFCLTQNFVPFIFMDLRSIFGHH